MVVYKVINSNTCEDITDDFDWVIKPNGELAYLEYCDLIGYPDAKVVVLSACNDIP